MKRHLLPSLLAALLCISTVASADGWQKFVSADGTFSFHHPAGWSATEQPSSVIVESGDGRQISLLALPYQPGQSAEVHARRMMGLLAAGHPGPTADNWHADEDDLAYAEVSFTEDGVAQAGDVLVMRDTGSQQALWFGFSAPAAEYDRRAALEMLQAVMGSVASGSGSQPPTAASTLTAEEQQIVTAFVFTLEFALGQPLDYESEQIIARELARGLAERGESFDDLSMYPSLARQIMTLDNDRLDELQRDLHGVLTEWLNENDPDDPAVGIVRERMDTRREVVAEADLLLSATAAQAYAELVTFSEVLNRNPQARLDQIPLATVREVRAQLIAQWPNLTSEQRAEVITAPDLWGVLRHATLLGDDAEAQQARSTIAGITGDPVAPTGETEDIRTQMTRNFVVQETLRLAQQTTFNTWRWSMGYCAGPMGF
ncbi:MAG: hypothetical protein ACOCX2_13605 [Armatimonadota bacterium]